MNTTIKLFVLIFAINLIGNSYSFNLIASNGAYCVSECLKGSDGRYSCRIGHRVSDHCSPFKDTSASGVPCRHKCDKQGYSYYWCKILENDKYGYNWDYCGITVDANKYTYVVSKSYNAYCIDDCDYRGYSYQWCNTFNGWDYCDRSSIFKTDKFYLSIYGDRCLSECMPYNDYYYCDIAHNGQWEYCSRYPVSTYKAEMCRKDHQCDKHGYNYYWCYTDYRNNWDYCSPQIDCGYWPTDAFDYHQRETKCTIEEIHSYPQNLVFTIERDWNTSFGKSLYDNMNFMRKNITDVISDMNLSYMLSFCVKDCDKILYKFVYIDVNVNIELTGFSSGIEYANIKLVHTRVWSPTVAHVIVPIGVNIPPRYVKQALMSSFRNQAIFRLSQS